MGRQLKRVERPELEASITVACKISSNWYCSPTTESNGDFEGSRSRSAQFVSWDRLRIETTGECRNRIDLRTQRLRTRKAGGEITFQPATAPHLYVKPHGRVNKLTVRRRQQRLRSAAYRRNQTMRGSAVVRRMKPRC